MNRRVATPKSIAPILLLSAVASACATSQTTICDNRIRFSEPQKFRLNQNEALLACGDPSTEAWREIPLSQSEYHLRTFLSLRGYPHPEFDYQKDHLIVRPGKQLVANELTFIDAPEGFEKVRFRKIIGEPITTELLNTVEASVMLRLKDMGYACPSLTVTALEDNGQIQVRVKAGTKHQFTRPILLNFLDLEHSVIRRFDAFSSGQPYRYDWLRLTEMRAENDGIVVSSQLTSQCPQLQPELLIEHKLVGGEKRLLTIGAGISTEEFPILQATWKNVRMSSTGSNLAFTLYGSQRTQRIKGLYALYLFPNFPRLHWDPTAKIERKNEPSFRSYEVEGSVPLVYQFDYQDSAIKITSGPIIKRSFSEAFGNEKVVTFLNWMADLTWFTHSYELYQSDPRQGTSISFNAEILNEGLELNYLGTVLKLYGTHLMPVNSVYPVQWILGFRYGANTTLTGGDTRINDSELPAQYFHTLGGDENMRGFSRNQLNLYTVGALTTLFGSAELRFAKTLPIGIEPFAFFDLGSLGSKSMHLDPTLYYSPGLGTRISSPIGVFRTTFSQGFMAFEPAPDPKSKHFQFFFSYGKEF